jgi:probable rRNA maturation factor
MRDLNRTFLKKDRPANVLSFPPGQTFPGEVKSLGDLALSGETIKREAGDLGWTEGAAFYFYLIHGLLHLLGYDHSLGPDEDMAQTEETERLFALIPHGL